MAGPAYLRGFLDLSTVNVLLWLWRKRDVALNPVKPDITSGSRLAVIGCRNAHAIGCMEVVVNQSITRISPYHDYWSSECRRSYPLDQLNGNSIANVGFYNQVEPVSKAYRENALAN